MTQLDWADIGLMAAGTLVVAVVLLREGLAGWQDPLRHCPIRANRLSPLAFWFCLMAYLMGGLVGSMLGEYLVPTSLSGPVRDAWVGVVASFVLQIVTGGGCLLVAYVTFRAVLRGFGFRAEAFWREVAWACGGWLAVLALCGGVIWCTRLAINYFLPDFEPSEHTVFTILNTSETGVGVRMLTVFGAVVLAPVGEEILFRGILQTAFMKLVPVRHHSRRHRWWAIGLASVLFGFMHFGTSQYIPALIVLGVVLGYLYEKRGSLLTPIVVHMLFNTKSMVWYFFST